MLLSIWPWGSNFSEILIEIANFSFTKMHLKISSAKWRQFCPGEVELKLHAQQQHCLHMGVGLGPLAGAYNTSVSVIVRVWHLTVHCERAIETRNTFHGRFFERDPNSLEDSFSWIFLLSIINGMGPSIICSKSVSYAHTCTDLRLVLLTLNGF